MSDFPLLLASEMGVTRRTVTRWCAAGKVPGAYRTKGGHWRLRKPRRPLNWRRYDDRVNEFVVRYTSVPGDPLSVRQAAQLKKIALWLDDLCLIPATVSIGRRMVPPRADGTLTFDWQFVAELEKLIDSKDFNAALEFSLGAAGISDDDKLPEDWKKIPLEERGRALRQHFEDLKDRDPKKYDLLTERDMEKMMHPRAYKAVKKIREEPARILEVKAQKLRLNMRDVTPANLARELKILVATLYRRYGREAVRRACRPVPVCDESPASVRYHLS